MEKAKKDLNESPVATKEWCRNSSRVLLLHWTTYKARGDFYTVQPANIL